MTVLQFPEERIRRHPAPKPPVDEHLKAEIQTKISGLNLHLEELVGAEQAAKYLEALAFVSRCRATLERN